LSDLIVLSVLYCLNCTLAQIDSKGKTQNNTGGKSLPFLAQKSSPHLHNLSLNKIC